MKLRKSKRKKERKEEDKKYIEEFNFLGIVRITYFLLLEKRKMVVEELN